MAISAPLRRLWLSLMLAAIVALPAFTALLLWPQLREQCIRTAFERSTDPATWWPPSWRQELKALRKLREPVTIEFVETPLIDVADFLHELTGVPFQLDEPRLKQTGIDREHPVTIHVEQISLGSALKLMFDNLDAKLRIEGGIVRISRREPGEPTMPDLAATKPGSRAEQRVHERLDSIVTLEFVATPFDDVIDFLREVATVNIVLDRKWLEEQHIDLQTPITIHQEQVPLRNALRIMLDPLDATYRVEDEVLRITARADEHDTAQKP